MSIIDPRSITGNEDTLRMMATMGITLGCVNAHLPSLTYVVLWNETVVGEFTYDAKAVLWKAYIAIPNLRLYFRQYQIFSGDVLYAILNRIKMSLEKVHKDEWV